MVAASALSLSPAYKASYINFLWKGPLTVKVRKKIINQILGYISFCIKIRAHLGHLFA